MLNVKYGNKFFICDMGLVSGDYLLRKRFYPKLTTENFLLNRDKEKRKFKPTAEDKRFFTYAYAKL